MGRSFRSLILHIYLQKGKKPYHHVINEMDEVENRVLMLESEHKKGLRINQALFTIFCDTNVIAFF